MMNILILLEHFPHNWNAGGYEVRIILFAIITRNRQVVQSATPHDTKCIKCWAAVAHRTTVEAGYSERQFPA